ncbi:hypothetical protein AAC387_Pa03g3319 [Persea americana]
MKNLDTQTETEVSAQWVQGVEGGRKKGVPGGWESGCARGCCARSVVLRREMEQRVASGGCCVQLCGAGGRAAATGRGRWRRRLEWRREREMDCQGLLRL